jgi:hypothetical protein
MYSSGSVEISTKRSKFQHCTSRVQHTHDVGEFLCAWFRPSLVTHFNTTVPASPTGSKKSGWDHVTSESDPPPLPAIPQIVLSPVKLCLSLREFDWFHVLWIETLPQSFKVLYTSKNRFILLYFISLFLCFWGYFIYLLLAFHKSLPLIAAGSEQHSALRRDLVCTNYSRTCRPHCTWRNRRAREVTRLLHDVSLSGKHNFK